MLQNYKENIYFNTEDAPAKLERNESITLETKYLGFDTKLKGTEGLCYFNVSEDAWLYQPNGETTLYRVPFYLLSVNQNESKLGYYVEATYIGSNAEIKGKIGRLYLDEPLCRFRVDQTMEVYRVNLSNCKF